MLTDKCAAKFFSKMYHDVWANYSTKELHNYYSTDLVSRSGQHEFCYEELHTLLEVNPNRFSFMTPEIHRVKAVADDALTAWFTTWHYGHDDKVAMRIDTMTNYKIKDDKVISVDFMWDQPIDLVMGYATQHSLNVLNKMLPYEMQKLTLRELQCFFHIIQAKSAKQIARALTISARTVESHTSNIKEKLNLTTTRAVVEFAFEHNLVSLSPLLNSIFTDEEPYAKY